MRLVFAGTPQVALPALEAVLGSHHEVVAVLTRPDAPSGRGRQVMASPVRDRAESLGIEVLTPYRLDEREVQDRLRALAPDCGPVVAYGALVPLPVLRVPPHGWVNLHFSVLPSWRGAAPIQRALIAGDEVVGATTFQLDEGLDTGPVYGVMTELVRPDDTAGSLLTRVAEGGAQLLLRTLDGIEDGSLQPVPQSTDGVSTAPKLSVDDARVDWSAPAGRIDHLVRGCTPSPGAWTTFRGERLKLGPVQLPAVAGESEPLAPGRIEVNRRFVRVGTGTAPVRLGQVQPHGRRAMPAVNWARGARIAEDERFDS
ncbi:MAG: methionyl-tRNA formyltransferase [Actinomycetales bacterium]